MKRQGSARGRGKGCAERLRLLTPFIHDGEMYLAVGQKKAVHMKTGRLYDRTLMTGEVRELRVLQKMLLTESTDERE